MCSVSFMLVLDALPGDFNATNTGTEMKQLFLFLMGLKLPAMFCALFLQRLCASLPKQGLSGVHRSTTAPLACQMSP